jgi:hypothetical protein
MLPWASPSQGVRLRLCTGVRPRSSHALPRPGLATEPPAPRSIDQPQPRLVRQPANQLPHKATLTGFSHRNTPERSSESLSGLLGSPRVALCITANRRRSLDSRTALRKSLGCALRCRASRQSRPPPACPALNAAIESVVRFASRLTLLRLTQRRLRCLEARRSQTLNLRERLVAAFPSPAATLAFASAAPGSSFPACCFATSPAASCARSALRSAAPCGLPH